MFGRNGKLIQSTKQNPTRLRGAVQYYFLRDACAATATKRRHINSLAESGLKPDTINCVDVHEIHNPEIKQSE